MSSAAFTNNGALFIVWDEGDADVSDGPIGLLLLSPLANGRGYANNLYYTHSSLLRTLQEIFGVGPLLGDAANASNLSDLFLNGDLRLSASLNPANGLPQLTLTGLIAGKTNVVQSSSNLAYWLSLSTNVATTSAFTFTDAAHTNGHSRFYRAWEVR